MNRNRLEFIYSICVMIAVPLIVVANSIVITNFIRDAFKTEINRKADLANSIIANATSDLIEKKDYDKLSGVLESIEKNQPALSKSMIIVSDSGELKIVAKSSSANDEFNRMNTLTAIEKKWPVSSLTEIYDKNLNINQAWNVMTPLINDDGEVIAVVSSYFSNADAQETIDEVYKISIIALVIGVVLIIVLLFRHLRLLGYIQLLAKQKELNQTMSDFLSVATHELRAPTTIIKGYLSNVIEDNNQIEPTVKQQIGIALQQTERLNSLVQDLLNVSRVDQGKIQYNIKAVDTTKILNTLVDNYRPIVGEKGIEIIFNSSQSIPLVSADEGRVQEIFTNLIDNAYKYTAKGTITVEQKVTKNSVVINVRDSGFGMSPEAKERLFQRFYRVQTDQTSGIPGTGLGLWIIKQYIEVMGGKISVESMENVGSNFIVEFKIAK